MNTEEPPFDDVKVRQAVNYAVDPRGAGTDLRRPAQRHRSRSCRRACRATSNSSSTRYDLAKAKQMIKEANPSDMDITRLDRHRKPEQRSGRILQRGPQGSRLQHDAENPQRRQLLHRDRQRSRRRTSTPAGSNWFQDYPHPNDFFQPLLAGESIQPTNNYNFAEFDDPAVNKKITGTGRRTARARAGRRIRANSTRNHGRSALGAIREPDASDLRLRRDRSRKRHLQPDLRPVPDQLRIQVGARAGQR